MKSKRPLTNCTKSDKLRLKNNAICCPFCKHPFKVVRLHTDSVVRNVDLRCDCCKREITVNIAGTSAEYAASVIVESQKPKQ